jgi:hypothetical protein
MTLKQMVTTVITSLNEHPIVVIYVTLTVIAFLLLFEFTINMQSIGVILLACLFVWGLVAIGEYFHQLND